MGIRETLDQRELMFDLSTVGFGFLLGFVEFFVGGILLQCYLETVVNLCVPVYWVGPSD
jgi:hypothetical protein